MKICQLCASDFTVKNFLLPLIDRMTSDGHEVKIVCSQGYLINEMRRRGYLFDPIQISRSINPFKFLISIINLFFYFRRENFDIIHTHTPVASLAGRIAAKLAGCRTIVYTAHGFYFHDEMNIFKKKFFIWLEKIAGSCTDLILTQSREDMITAKNEKFLKEDQIFQIGNGVDPIIFNPNKVKGSQRLKDELGIKKNNFVVGMICRLVKEKGVVEFLESALKLSQKFENIKFLLVGERLSSDHNCDIEQHINYASNKLKNKLIITGMRTDIPELLSLMNIYILPSWREGMPRTIIEAMMMGLPVIATNIRGSREEVVDGVTGILVKLKSPEDITSAVEKIYSSRVLAKSFGKAGRIRAQEFFDENKILDRELELIYKFQRNNESF